MGPSSRDTNPAANPSDQLLAAVRANDPEAVRLALTADPSSASAPASDGAVPLVEACERGKLEVVRLLLDAGANARSFDALLAAAHAGPRKKEPALDVVELLIERGAPNDLFTHAVLGRVDELRPALVGADAKALGRALFLAAGNGHVEAARLLLEAGAGPNPVSSTGHTLWEYVFLHIWGAPYREIARMMLDRGVPCSFHQACLLGHLPTVRQLLATDPSLKDQPNADGIPPLVTAILAADVELARVLLEAGAQDPKGQGRALVEATPLEGRSFARALFRKCSFEYANLHDCTLKGAVFSDVNLAGARFSVVDLSNVTIDGAWTDGLTIYGIEVQPLLEAERKRREAEKKKA